MKTLILLHQPMLETVKRFCPPRSALLFLQESIYALINPDQATQDWLGEHTLYVLKDDAAARGLLDHLPTQAIVIDYAGWVELTVTHAPIVQG